MKKIIEDFEVSPRDDKYDNIVAPPIASFDSAQNTWKLLLGVFIWSTFEHIGLAIKCPEHKVVLNLSGWTDDLIPPGYSRNPRLLYQMGGNVLLKSVRSALSDLLTTSATHGTFSRTGTKRGLISIIKLMQFTIVRFF